MMSTRSNTRWGTIVLSLLLAVFLGFSSPVSAQSGNPDCQTAVRAKVDRLLDSEEVKFAYSWVFRASVEGVSFVRYIERPASYVLFGSPDLALSLVSGGAAGVAKDISVDAALALAKSALGHPSKHARKVASWSYQHGLDAYRVNYHLYNEAKSRDLTPDEKMVFHRNFYLQGLMKAARALYNDTREYERGSGSQRSDDFKEVAEAETQLSKLATVAQVELLSTVVFWARAIRVLSESKVGLQVYPPYLEYREAVLELGSRYEAAVDSVCSIAEPVTAGTPGTAGLEDSAKRRLFSLLGIAEVNERTTFTNVRKQLEGRPDVEGRIALATVRRSDSIVQFGCYDYPDGDCDRWYIRILVPSGRGLELSYLEIHGVTPGDYLLERPHLYLPSSLTEGESYSYKKRLTSGKEWEGQLEILKTSLTIRLAERLATDCVEVRRTEEPIPVGRDSPIVTRTVYCPGIGAVQRIYEPSEGVFSTTLSLTRVEKGIPRRIRNKLDQVIRKAAHGKTLFEHSKEVKSPMPAALCDFKARVDDLVFSTTYVSRQRELGGARITMDRHWELPGQRPRKRGVDPFCRNRECDVRGTILANGVPVTTFVISFKNGKHVFTAPGTTAEGMYEVTAKSPTHGDKRRAALIELAKQLATHSLEPCPEQPNKEMDKKEEKKNNSWEGAGTPLKKDSEPFLPT